MSPRLRRFRPSDSPAVRAVVRRALEEYGLWTEHEPGLQDLADIEAAYLRRGGQFLVVEDGGRVVGCGGLRPAGRRAWLQRMYLRREYRGRGLGRRMIRRLLSAARRARLREVWLESSWRYQDAIALYLRCGFLAGRTDCGGCCDVVMFRELEPNA